MKSMMSPLPRHLLMSMMSMMYVMYKHIYDAHIYVSDIMDQKATLGNAIMAGSL